MCIACEFDQLPQKISLSKQEPHQNEQPVWRSYLKDAVVFEAICKDVWEGTVGEVLIWEQEPNNT